MDRNLIEPAGLVRTFQEHPPEGFRAFDLCSGVAAFSASFDLLTTVDPSVRRVVDALPFATTWRRLLRARTCFIGTTVSEYALFPADASAEDVARCIIGSVGADYPFVIIKDVPGDSVLVGEQAFAWSQQLAAACRALGFVMLDGRRSRTSRSILPRWKSFSHGAHTRGARICAASCGPRPVCASKRFVPGVRCSPKK